MRKIALLLLACLSVSVIYAQKPDYNTVKTKADRYFKYEDWRSALAMYELLLAQDATDSETYARGIVVSGIIKENDLQKSFLERAEKNVIPYDTLFVKVKYNSLKLGEPYVYTDFMLRVRDSKPWLERMVNIRLLDFFLFRNDADNIIKIAEALLKDTQKNVQFLGALAEGYILKADFEKSAGCYKKILLIDKDNYDAVVNLGNYYDSFPKAENDSVSLKNSANALSCFRKAMELKPTPYIEKRVEELNELVNGPQPGKKRK